MPNFLIYTNKNCVKIFTMRQNHILREQVRNQINLDTLSMWNQQMLLIEDAQMISLYLLFNKNKYEFNFKPVRIGT